MVPKLHFLVGFALECFLSPFWEGEVIIVEFLKKTPHPKGNKSFKAKSIRCTQVGKKGSTTMHQLILIGAPPSFRGGELTYVKCDDSTSWNYCINEEDFLVEVTFARKKEKRKKGKCVAVVKGIAV